MFRVIFLLTIFSVALSSSNIQIKYVALIYRHGDRTPVNTYPKDPWRNESLWPVKFGELTNTGKSQHYDFGRWLRKRYSGLISDKFDPTEVYVRSTDFDRTLMSAQANLAGLYPPIGNSIWDNNLMWQPIPVHTVPVFEDELLSMTKACPAYDREKEKYLKSKTYNERISRYQGLMDYLAEHTGRDVKSTYNIDELYSVLYIENLYNFTLPNWTKSVYPIQMAEPAGYSFTVDTSTPIMSKLKIGPLLKQIVTNMFSVMETKHQKHLKMSMYSGHDYTIGCLLNGLGIFDGVCPVYTSTVFIELLYDGSSHFVRILYRNSTENVEPHVLSIPGCGEVCLISKFIKLYENLLNVDWETECNTSNHHFLGVFIFFSIASLIFMYVASCMLAKKPLRQNKIYVIRENPIKKQLTGKRKTLGEIGRQNKVQNDLLEDLL